MNTTGKTRKPVLLSYGSIYLPDIVQCPTDKNHHPGAAWSVFSHQGAARRYSTLYSATTAANEYEKPLIIHSPCTFNL